MNLAVYVTFKLIALFIYSLDLVFSTALRVKSNFSQNARTPNGIGEEVNMYERLNHDLPVIGVGIIAAVLIIKRNGG